MIKITSEKTQKASKLAPSKKEKLKAASMLIEDTGPTTKVKIESRCTAEEKAALKRRIKQIVSSVSYDTLMLLDEHLTEE